MTVLTDTLRRRRTEKILGDIDSPLPHTASHRQPVDDLLAHAAWAPYHYPADKSHRDGEFSSPVPWRFYKVDTHDCRKLMSRLSDPQLGAGKITAMLATADALILATWLPDPSADPLPDKQAYAATQRNMEHIAASGAAVHSLLLLATEFGYRTYWSSGGVLREPEMFRELQIPSDQVLIGAVFLFPEQVGQAQVKPGAWRDKRGEVGDWSAWRGV